MHGLTLPLHFRALPWLAQINTAVSTVSEFYVLRRVKNVLQMPIWALARFTHETDPDPKLTVLVSALLNVSSFPCQGSAEEDGAQDIGKNRINKQRGPLKNTTAKTNKHESSRGQVYLAIRLGGKGKPT